MSKAPIERVNCRDGANQFGCKYPDCNCKPLGSEEKATAFADAAFYNAKGNGPSKPPDERMKVTIRVELRDGRLHQYIEAPAHLKPGTYYATFEVKKD
jgi:hypothetical protein